MAFGRFFVGNCMIRSMAFMGQCQYKYFVAFSINHKCSSLKFKYNKIPGGRTIYKL